MLLNCVSTKVGQLHSYLYKDKAQYRTARDIWICTKDDRFSEIPRKKAEKCLRGKWCER